MKRPRVAQLVMAMGLALLTVGCSGDDDSAPAGPLGSAAPVAGGDDAVTDDAADSTTSGDDDCDLLSDEEIEASVGVAPVASTPPSLGRGCSWNDDDDSISLVSVQIGDDAITVDGAAASRFERTVERTMASGVAVTDIAGLGDRAAVAGGPPPNQVVVLVGDTYVEIIVSDSGVVQDGTVEELAHLVLERL